MGICNHCGALRPDLHSQNCPHVLGITNEDDPTMTKATPPELEPEVTKIEVLWMKVGQRKIWYCVLPLQGATNGFDSVTIGRDTPQELKLAATQYLYGVEGVA